MGHRFGTLRFVMALAIPIGIFLGYAGGIYLLPDSNSKSVYPPLYLFMRLDKWNVAPETLISGWAKPEDWGTRAAARDAVLQINPGRTIDSDLDLTIDMRPLPGKDRSPQRIAITINRGISTLFTLSAGNSKETRRIIIPNEVAQKSRPIRVVFSSIAVPGKTRGKLALGLETLTLQPADPFPVIKGTVDICGPSRVAGWAAADDRIVPVVIKLNGVEVANVLADNPRPDLPAHGLPFNAGFSYSLPRPTKEGDSIEVILPSGRSIGRGVCRS